MTQWLREQTEHQRLLDLNRELREELAIVKERYEKVLKDWDRRGDRINELREENAFLEAQNAQLVNSLPYDQDDHF